MKECTAGLPGFPTIMLLPGPFPGVDHVLHTKPPEDFGCRSFHASIGFEPRHAYSRWHLEPLQESVCFAPASPEFAAAGLRA